MDQDKLKEHWERYLDKGTSSLLADFVIGHPQAQEVCAHEYPYLHRICDLTLYDKRFRVLRCIACNGIAGNERLMFKPIDVEYSGKSGVPYWLSGEGLRKWAEAEEEVEGSTEPEDYETQEESWERWRSSDKS